ncbi:unnamed protein product [Cunninghamella blakesleeana]
MFIYSICSSVYIYIYIYIHIYELLCMYILNLNSIISSLIYAYISQQQTTDKLFIPFIKVPLCDLHLRPEVKYVFEQAGIETNDLVCLNKASMMTDWKNKADDKLDIILVDHNQLTPPTSELKHHNVIGIIDHHVDEKQYLNVPLRWIEMVGSCTSQVILLLKDELKQLSIDDQKAIAKLALAPILVDTIGLKWEFGKTTQKDIDAFEIVSTILYGTKEISQQAIDYYDSIESIKTKVDHLCTRDLLRKDYKQWTVNGYRIGTSSMSWYLKAWLERDGCEEIVKDTMSFIEERQLDMNIVLTSYDHSKEGGKYERELALFVKNDDLLDIKKDLENDHHIGLRPLQQANYNNNNHLIGFYHQENIKLSRKQIWPIIQELLNKKRIN